MFNYIAYELGGKTPHKVTQMRWEDGEQYVAINGIWYNTKECILCSGSGIKDSVGNEIFEGDIVQLNIVDPSCCCRDRIGFVSFSNGKFFWSTGEWWGNYSLSGKSWKKLGSIAYDMKSYFTNEQIKKCPVLQKTADKIFGCSSGVLIEKNKPNIIISNNETNTFGIKQMIKQDEKRAKTLLHQYKNYLKIKKMIDNKEIIPEILDSNLGLIEKNNC